MASFVTGTAPLQDPPGQKGLPPRDAAPALPNSGGGGIARSSSCSLDALMQATEWLNGGTNMLERIGSPSPYQYGCATADGGDPFDGFWALAPNASSSHHRPGGDDYDTNAGNAATAAALPAAAGLAYAGAAPGHGSPAALPLQPATWGAAAQQQQQQQQQPAAVLSRAAEAAAGPGSPRSPPGAARACDGSSFCAHASQAQGAPHRRSPDPPQHPPYYQYREARSVEVSLYPPILSAGDMGPFAAVPRPEVSFVPGTDAAAYPPHAAAPYCAAANLDGGSFEAAAASHAAAAPYPRPLPLPLQHPAGSSGGCAYCQHPHPADGGARQYIDPSGLPPPAGPYYVDRRESAASNGVCPHPQQHHQRYSPAAHENAAFPGSAYPPPAPGGSDGRPAPPPAYHAAGAPPGGHGPYRHGSNAQAQPHHHHHHHHHHCGLYGRYASSGGDSGIGYDTTPLPPSFIPSSSSLPHQLQDVSYGPPPAAFYGNRPGAVHSAAQLASPVGGDGAYSPYGPGALRACQSAPHARGPVLPPTYLDGRHRHLGHDFALVGHYAAPAAAAGPGHGPARSGAADTASMVAGGGSSAVGEGVTDSSMQQQQQQQHSTASEATQGGFGMVRPMSPFAALLAMHTTSGVNDGSQSRAGNGGGRQSQTSHGLARGRAQDEGGDDSLVHGADAHTSGLLLGAFVATSNAPSGGGSGKPRAAAKAAASARSKGVAANGRKAAKAAAAAAAAAIPAASGGRPKRSAAAAALTAISTHAAASRSTGGGASEDSGTPDEEDDGANKQRSSKFRGVTRHRRSGRWEAHIWIRDIGRQVYLGGYEQEEHAAEAYDVAALKTKGRKVKTNFDLGRYTDLLGCMDSISLEELIMAVRRQSQGFSRGSSTFRGVTAHPSGRWESRIGIPGSKHIYLGLWEGEQDAASAYDRALVRLRGTAAATNFGLAEYRLELAEYHQIQQAVLLGDKRMDAIMQGGPEFERWIKHGSSAFPSLVPLVTASSAAPGAAPADGAAPLGEGRLSSTAGVGADAPGGGRGSAQPTDAAAAAIVRRSSSAGGQQVAAANEQVLAVSPSAPAPAPAAAGTGAGVGAGSPSGPGC